MGCVSIHCVFDSRSSNLRASATKSRTLASSEHKALGQRAISGNTRPSKNLRRLCPGNGSRGRTAQRSNATTRTLRHKICRYLIGS